VVLFHLQYENWATGSQYSHFGLNWINRGYLGVDFFFILSGFILPYAHSELSGKPGTPEKYKVFIVKRFARIYPAYIFLILLWVALEGSKFITPAHSIRSSLTAYDIWHANPAFSGDWSIENLFFSALMLQATGMDVGSGWNGPGWSVSAEIFTYFILPILWLKLRTATTPALLIMIVLCQCLMYTYAHLHNGSLHIFKGPILIRCLIEGTMGSILYYIFQRGILKKTLSKAIISIAALALIIILVRFRHRIPVSDATFLPIFSLMIISLAYIDASGQKTFLHRLKYMGEISFSLYLCHYLMILLSQSVIAKFHFDDSVTREASINTVAICSSILCAVVIHKYIELPGRRFMMQKFLS
jgi:peptidoglycan/LPS O-acetylase OafA/YrhL